MDSGRQLTPDAYLSLLRQRLSASYDIETQRTVGSILYPLYARSQLRIGQYLFHRSVTYERMELNEHVLCHVQLDPVTPEQVASFVEDLKRSVDELVTRSDEHMSSALTGVLIARAGFSPEAAHKVTKSGFTKHFRLGLQGWCFLRLLGVDLTTGHIWANRRGKEVMSAYSPG